MRVLISILSLLMVSCNSTLTTKSACEGIEENVKGLPGVYALNAMGIQGKLFIKKISGAGNYEFMFEVDGDPEEEVEVTSCLVGDQILLASKEEQDFGLLKLNQLNALTYNLEPATFDESILDSLGVRYESFTDDFGGISLTIYNDSLSTEDLMQAYSQDPDSVLIQFTKI